MGGCLSSNANREPPSGSEASSEHIGGNTAANTVTIGKNKPLATEKPKWKSEIALTMGQLRSKRDEYWETQPAFGGRREIWDALRAACETDDTTLAQAIINGASIALPTGALSDAYDELGNHYVIPIYCISLPTNLIQNDNEGTTSSASKNPIELEQATGEEIMVKIRLSDTHKDNKMIVRTGESIAALKRRVFTDYGVEVSKQRWFFAGKLLYDKLTIGETKISKGFVVQVVVTPDEQ